MRSAKTCWSEKLKSRMASSPRRITRSSTRKSKNVVRKANSGTRNGQSDPTADCSQLHLQVTAELPQLAGDVLPPGKYRIGDVIKPDTFAWDCRKAGIASFSR